MKTDELDITDLFCGAGGSGLGAEAAGFNLYMAANHWDKAIETHAANFPDTEHDCADISQVNPRRYKRTKVLWASPECTNHSQAKGVRRDQNDRAPDANGEILPLDAAERSRATMWDVVRFAEHHLYDAVIVENVVEAARWIMFPAWLLSMQLLGYEYQMVSLNSMHAEGIDAPRAPQSRDRLYIVFHRKGARRPNVTPTPLAWCGTCEADVVSVQTWKNGRTVGKYRSQYIYQCGAGHTVEPYALAAAAAINWALPGKRIGDRATPLSPKTMARIQAGLEKFGRPMTFEARGNTFVRTGKDGRPVYARAWPTDQPTATLTTSETRALVVPLEGRDGKVARSVTEPHRTQTARHQDALVVPYYGTATEAKTVDEPLGALSTRDRFGVVVPDGAFLTQFRERNRNIDPTVTPLPTVVSDGASHALVVPAGGTWNDTAKSAEEPFTTRTTRETDGIAFVAELRGMNSSHNRALRSTDQPLAGVTAGGNHHMLVRHNTARGNPGQMCTSADEPARTLTTAGHQSLVSIVPDINDATFRMLEPDEIQAAMAFRYTYRVLGTRREKVRQLGNGVTPPAAEMLLRAVAEALDVA